jgi:hypothetical protein
MRLRFALFSAAVLAASPVVAADTLTVQSLISDGYVVSSSWMSPIGPAIVLQKSDKLYLCFVTERPDSPDIATKYCKPVH